LRALQQKSEILSGIGAKSLDIFLKYIEHFGIYVEYFLKDIELIRLYAERI